MKRLLFLLPLVLIFSCKKYEDGPALSLLSKKSRVANKWRVDKYYLNGNDMTVNYRSIITKETFQFFKGGSWQYTEASNWIMTIPYDHGTWSFANDKEDIEVVSDLSGMPVKTYHILRLKSKEMWLERQVTPDSLVEMHYIPQTE
jgi:hypothetical protein